MKARRPDCESVFEYSTRQADPLFQVVRKDFPDGSKQITQRRADSKSPAGFIYSIKDVPRPLPLYNLPIVAELSSGETLLVVEGEKHADTLVNLGFMATTSAMGAGKSGQSDWSPSRGLDVVLMPDNDGVGRRHMEDVAARCRAAGAARVRWLELPGLPEKGDVLDWLADGGDPEDLGSLIAAAPEAQPYPEIEIPGNIGNIGNNNGLPAAPGREDERDSVTDVTVVTGYRFPDTEWAAPRLGGPEPAERFPLDVLPVPLQRFCTEAAAAMQCPVDFLAVSVLSLSGAVLGMTVNLAVKAQYNEAPNLFVALVGRPGVKKSPAIKAVARPL